MPPHHQYGRKRRKVTRDPRKREVRQRILARGYSGARLPLSAYGFMLDAALLLSLAETKEQQDFLLDLIREKVKEGRGINYAISEIRAATAIIRHVGWWVWGRPPASLPLLDSPGD